MDTKDDFDRLRPAAQNGGLVGDVRLSTVNRIARLHIAGEAGLARVHTLFDGGIELSSIMDLRMGQAIRVDFSETVSLTATVAGKACNRYALAFQRPVNCAELLRRLVAEARSKRARPLRLATGRVSANGRSAEGVHKLEVDDISQRGMKVRHDGSFKAGLRVSVQLPNGRECQGVVRWTKESSAGLQLVDILSAEELGAVSFLGDGIEYQASREG
ncbi:MAG: hypothetical protein E7773_14680 [Sphingomonas sp.]|uniref:PilZ domain-containing protein n=1 Tax=Sphingomonas sp. TaxID=28214 RepID=UPI0011FB819E|nr:PilZ domain-containing protein [Sphingomonas sp.]THD34434.1 MAG: hypothetical protein E7773_14680 [Sphingomonas sp.]